MALIERFEKLNPIRKKRHQTKVDCGYFSLEEDNEKIIQLNTYGSPDRQIPGKVSQTLQLNRNGAENLIAILRKEFELR